MFRKKTQQPVILQNILHKLRKKSCCFCYSSNKLFRLHSKCKTKLFADVKKHWKVLRKMINSFKAKQNNWHIIFEATEWGWIFMILLKLLLRKKLIILKKKNIFLIYIFLTVDGVKLVEVPHTVRMNSWKGPFCSPVTEI